MLIEFRARLHERSRRPRQPVANGTHRPPEVGQLETEDDVRLRDQLPSVAALIERVARGEVHASALIDDRGLQRLGQLDQTLHSGRRARRAVGDDHRVPCVDQQLRRLGDRTRITLRRRGARQLRDAQPRRDLRRDGILLQSRRRCTSSTGIIGGVIAIL